MRKPPWPRLVGDGEAIRIEDRDARCRRVDDRRAQQRRQHPAIQRARFQREPVRRLVAEPVNLVELPDRIGRDAAAGKEEHGPRERPQEMPQPFAEIRQVVETAADFHDDHRISSA